MGNIDDNVPICDELPTIDWDENTNVILKNLDEVCKCDSDVEDDDNTKDDSSALNFNTANDNLLSLKSYALSNGLSEMFDSIMKIQDIMAENQCNIITKQTTITDYFK